MKLNLVNVDQFIEKNKLKEVSSTNITMPNNPGRFDPNGLWSEEIFGIQNSKQRKSTFAYIDLKTKVFHPEIYLIMIGTNALLKKVALNSAFAVIDPKSKKIIESDEKNGETGIAFLVKNIENYDFVLNSKENKLEDAEYLEKNKDNLLISKWLVIPPGNIRDININRISNRKLIMSEINELYIDLLNTVSMLQTTMIGGEVLDTAISKIQAQIHRIDLWLKARMRGKPGMIRSSLLKKSVDYCARSVIGGDPSIPLGYIGLPWHLVLVTYEPFFIHYLTKTSDGKELASKIADYLEIDTKLGYNDIIS